MSIIVYDTSHGVPLERAPQRESFKGAVLEIFERNQTRNVSDTLDYTDFRTVKCTYALVWLPAADPNMIYRRWRQLDFAPGTYTLSVHHRYGNEESVDWSKNEPFEQFGWIDCSNMFAWRNETLTLVTDDAFKFVMPFTGKMIEAYIIFKEKLEQLKQMKADAARADAIRKEAEERRLLEIERAKSARDSAAREVALNVLSSSGLKFGQRVVTSKGTGQITWTGVNKYRGQHHARVGVRINGHQEYFSVLDVKRAV